MYDHVATNSEALAEFAYNAGMDHPDEEWLLSSWDTWERNPHYTGKPGPHPESDDYYEELDMTVAEAECHQEEGDKRLSPYEEFAKEFEGQEF